jgi:hypothetical protein
MKITKIVLITSAVLINLISLPSCKTIYINESKPNRLEKVNLNLIDNDKAKIKFVDSGRNAIELLLIWTDRPNGEYSRFGPMKDIIVTENGKIIPTSSSLNFTGIEDIALNSCQMYKTDDGYVLEMAWGVGESLAFPNEVLLRRISQ